ncbi:MAG TPA: PaaI family thioesterase [Luteibaculaceae bacterium]|nr:PaaI family thioesterase [Luteibaculaceae bacterium]
MHPILELYNQINHFANTNGMTYRVIQPGEVEYRMQVKDEHQSGPGVAHGGLVAGFMDAVIGVAALSSVVDEFMLVSTVEFKINFLKPVKIGQEIVGMGKVDSKGQRIIVSSGVIYDAQGEPLAKATGTFNAYPADKIREKVGNLFTF